MNTRPTIDLPPDYRMGSRYEGLDLRGADFRSSDLSGSHFAGANLEGAKFTGGELTHVDFRGANLRGADLGDIAIGHVRFEGADLRDADFSDSFVYDVYFDAATRLKGARNLALVPAMDGYSRTIYVDGVRLDDEVAAEWMRNAV